MVDDVEDVDAVLGLLFATVLRGGIQDLADACEEMPEFAAKLEAAAQARPELLGDSWAQVQAARAHRAIESVYRNDWSE